MPASQIDSDFRLEVWRKLIHLLGLLIPVVYYFTDRGLVLWCLAPLTAVALIVDVAHHRSSLIGAWFLSLFGPLLRDRELSRENKRLTAATLLLFGAFVTVAAFPKYAAVLALSIYVTGDAAAALVGRRFGRHPVGTRSLEGSGAFLIVALAVIAVTPRLGDSPGEYVICGLAAIVGTAVELLLPEAVDDNLAVPVLVAATLWIAYAVVYPETLLTTYGR